MIRSIPRRDAKESVGKGWRRLLDILYDAKPKNVPVLEVKEKWGGLRFYVGASEQSYLDLVNAVEGLSFKICEACGKQGRVRNELSWLKTLCEECYDFIYIQPHNHRNIP